MLKANYFVRGTGNVVNVDVVWLAFDLVIELPQNNEKIGPYIVTKKR